MLRTRTDRHGTTGLSLYGRMAVCDDAETNCLRQCGDGPSRFGRRELELTRAVWLRVGTRNAGLLADAELADNVAVTIGIVLF